MWVTLTRKARWSLCLCHEVLADTHAVIQRNLTFEEHCTHRKQAIAEECRFYVSLDYPLATVSMFSVKKCRQPRCRTKRHGRMFEEQLATYTARVVHLGVGLVVKSPWAERRDAGVAFAIRNDIVGQRDGIRSIRSYQQSESGLRIASHPVKSHVLGYADGSIT
ncbi:unnamed protein product [Schistocephalus solidus]|uniref:Transposase n=1 Tax=Schistocephalus solidus TaxID=70667 RepID=A0A183SXS5_SCHSO|nr:unnamed protein product [Schistocephalus solidus]